MDGSLIMRDTGLHGGGLWSAPMTKQRIDGVVDWLNKAPPSHAYARGQAGRPQGQAPARARL